jgi:hypothetical protein
MGPQGPSGILNVMQLAMNGPRQPPYALVDFLAAEILVQITDPSQRFYVNTQAVFSTKADANLTVRLCAKFQGGFNPQQFGPLLRNIVIPANTPTAVSLSGLISGLSPGAYYVGMCGSTTQGSAFNASGDSYTNVLVLR